jgi:Protein of unknown function (DUF2934)
MTAQETPTRQEIIRRAYALYLLRDCKGKEGRDVDDWLRAEKQLSNELVAGTEITKAAQVGC